MRLEISSLIKEKLESNRIKIKAVESLVGSLIISICIYNASNFFDLSINPFLASVLVLSILFAGVRAITYNVHLKLMDSSFFDGILSFYIRDNKLVKNLIELESLAGQTGKVKLFFLLFIVVFFNILFVAFIILLFFAIILLVLSQLAVLYEAYITEEFTSSSMTAIYTSMASFLEEILIVCQHSNLESQVMFSFLSFLCAMFFKNISLVSELDDTARAIEYYTKIKEINLNTDGQLLSGSHDNLTNMKIK